MSKGCLLAISAVLHTFNGRLAYHFLRVHEDMEIPLGESILYIHIPKILYDFQVKLDGSVRCGMSVRSGSFNISMFLVTSTASRCLEYFGFNNAVHFFFYAYIHH